MKVDKRYQYIGLLGCLLLVIGNFWDFAKVSIKILGISVSKSVEFFDGDGKIVLVCAIVTALLIIFNKTKLSIVTLGISAFCVFYDMANANDVVKDKTFSLGTVSFEFGCYVLIAGIVLTAICIIMDFIENRNNRVKELGNEEEIKFCGECGSTIKSTSKFCPTCGKEQ